MTRGPSDIERVFELIDGYRKTCLVVAAVQIGLFEQLREPRKEEALAEALGAHAPSLHRLLRALRTIGLVQLGEDGVSLTSKGRVLLHRELVACEWAKLVGEEYLLAWANLRHSVMTGQNAFEEVFHAKAWEHRQRHPHLDRAFNAVTAGDQRRTLGALLSSYDLSASRTIVDVGGGHGGLLAGILSRLPSANGIVFDQPHVVAGADAVLEAARVKERCTTVGGSFFESVPSGADTYIMKHVLHNWDDADATQILSRCASAMSPESKLLVLEHVIDDDEDAATAMLDIHMLAVLGGRERTEAEYRSLFAAAGLRLLRVVPTRPGVVDILEVSLDQRGA